MKKIKYKFAFIKSWAKSCILTFTLINFGFHPLSNAQSDKIWPVEISFNWDSGSSTNDAITIKKDGSTSISIPEYVKGVRKENFAYIKNQSTHKIKVKFNSNDNTNNYLVKATVISGTGIGNVCEMFVAPCDLNSTVYTQELSGSIPGSVGKRTFTWTWEATAFPLNSPYCPITCDTVNTQHTYYTVLATPQAPMSIPWTDVLDFACVWAANQSTVAGSAYAITNSLYNSGFKYDVPGGGEPHYGSWTLFELSTFISHIGDSKLVNCQDMGKALTTFGNAIGCGLGLASYGWTYYGENPIDGPLNCIDPIGTPGPTNNPFGSPSIEDDCRTTGFCYHAFSELTSNNNVWDATLKYDIDEDPDNVVNSNPDCGDTSSGHSWKLPANEAEGTYISRLIDPWPKWYEDTPTFKRNRSFRVN